MRLDWGSVPDWLGAIGTIGATSTALWLARKADRPRVEMFVHPSNSRGRSSAKPFLFNQGYDPFTVLWIHAGAGWPNHRYYASGEFDRRPLGHGQGVNAEIDITEVVDAVLKHGKWDQWKRGLARFSVVAELSNGQRVRRELDRWQVATLLDAGRIRAAGSETPAGQAVEEAE